MAMTLLSVLLEEETTRYGEEENASRERIKRKDGM